MISLASLLLFALNAAGCGASTTSPGTGAKQPAMVTRHGSPVSIAAGATGTSTATCASGEQLLGGGFVITGTTAFAVRPQANYPSDASTWSVIVTDPAGTGPISILAFADCLQSTLSVKAVIVTSTYATSPHVFAGVFVTCPIGAYLVGGGWTTSGTQTAGNLVIDAHDLGNSTYTVATATEDGATAITAYGVCATQNLVREPHDPKSQNAPVQQSSDLSDSCASGELLASGGFFIHPEVGIQASAPDGATASPSPLVTWRITTYNPTTAPEFRRLYLACTKVQPGAPPAPTDTPLPPTPAPSPTFTSAPTTAASPAKLSVSVTPSLSGASFDCNGSGAPGYPVFTVKNTGGSALTWSAVTDDATQVTLSPKSGTLSAGATVAVNLSGSATNAQLTGQLKVTFSSNGGSASFTVPCGKP